MSAEILRRAAALMRERAEAAPSGEGWYVDAGDVWVMHDPDGKSASCLVESFPIWAGGADKHIASWHPAVALAVADLLDHAREAHLGVTPGNFPSYVQALTVARAFLGESSKPRAECRCPDDCDCDGRFACEERAGDTTRRCELVVGHSGWHVSGNHRWTGESA